MQPMWVFAGRTCPKVHFTHAQMFNIPIPIILLSWSEWYIMSNVVLGIGHNFLVDHRFCITDWSSINNRHVENRFNLNLAPFPVVYYLLQINNRGIQIIIFLFLQGNICCEYSLEAPTRGASKENHYICFHWEIWKISVHLGWLI